MNILVCIKQVPGTSQVEIDEKTGVLKRDGVESKMNPFDLYALETALRLKQQYGATITVLTMGPPQAEMVIREAFMMGADHGFVLSDRRFGGADVLATSYTLSQGVRIAGDVDLVICGKQTTDGDTAQVGAELADGLKDLMARNPDKIDAVRGRGLHLALGTKNNVALVDALRTNGLLTAPGGNGAVRFLPPLNVSSDEVCQALDILGRTLANARIF